MLFDGEIKHIESKNKYYETPNKKSVFSVYNVYWFCFNKTRDNLQLKILTQWISVIDL